MRFLAHIVASMDVVIEADDVDAAEQLADRITVAQWRMRSSWPTINQHVTAKVAPSEPAGRVVTS